jgi:hypothetical protein
MPRNRTIYNSQALYVSRIPATAQQLTRFDIRQLSRIQSFNEDFTRNFTDINQFGNLAAIDRVEVENPDITASFSYFLTDGVNERSIGLNVYQLATPSSELRSCLSGILTKQTDQKNYYLSIIEEGSDAAGYAGRKSGVIGIGNGFLTSYSINAAVGEIPTAEVEIEGLNIRVYTDVNSSQVVPAINPVNGTNLTNRFFRLYSAKSITSSDSFFSTETATALQPGDIIFSLTNNDTIGFDGTDLKIQDFTLSFDLPRTPIQKLGNRFPFSREIDFPVTATLEVNAEVGDLRSGNLATLLCTESIKDFTILMKKPGCGTNKDNALAYLFKGAKLVSQNFSSTIGDNATMSASYEIQMGGPQDVNNNIFISGSFQDYNALIVEDAGSSTSNDIYVYVGMSNGKPYYRGINYDANIISFGQGNQWELFDENVGEITYVISSTSFYPWTSAGTMESTDPAYEPPPVIYPGNFIPEIGVTTQTI